MDDRRDIQGVKDELSGRAEELALYLFGDPPKRTRAEMRWGRKGSLVVKISGPRRGSFRSWEEDRGGSMLDAIAFAQDIPIAEAVQWGRRWLGEDDRLRPARRGRPVVEDIDAEETHRIEQVRRIWSQARPIPGTAGETYLKSRGIGPNAWPESIRWAGNMLVFASTSPVGELTALQRIYINSDGTPKIEDGQKVKRSLGPGRGGAVCFPGETDGHLCLAEGPETALSVWYATGFETWAALGAIGKVDLSPVPIDRTVIVCKDDDAKNAPSRKALRDAIRKWRAAGRTVLEVLPFELSRRDKSDMNDSLVEHGPRYIRERIEKVLDSNPSQTTHGLHLMEARKMLARATGDAFEELWQRKADKPALVLKVGIGLGKTREALASAVQWVAEGRGPVVYAVPTHHLSAELLARTEKEIAHQKADITVAVWRGREAEGPATGETMCQDIETVKAVQAVGGNPQDLVCEKNGRQCPYFSSCPYQAQRRQRADIWLVAHHALFTQKPEAIPEPSLLVIDESFWRAGLRGIDGHPVIVAKDQLATTPYKTKAVGGYDIFGTADLDATLTPIRRRLLKAIGSTPSQTAEGVPINGGAPLTRESLVEAGLTHDQAIQAGKLEWRRKVDVGGFPGMDAKARRKVLLAAAINKDIPRMARMWREVAGILDGCAETSGRLSVEDIEDKDAGGRYRAIRLRWREDIKEGWRAPTLHIDATVDLDLVRPYFPRAELRADIKAATPHQRVTQHYDKTFSKASLAHDEKAVEKLWSWVRAQAFQKGGRWLVVSQKVVEDLIRSSGEVPAFIELAHHNAISGRDRWKYVDHLVVIGRTQPPPQTVAHIAGALTGRYVEPLTGEDGWYPATMRTLQAKDGKAVTVETDQHPDPLAERIRAAVCEDELVQIIGRGRGVNRTAVNPLEVIVLGNVPIGETDELQPLRSPSLDDHLVAAGSVWLSNSADMAEAYGRTVWAIERNRESGRGGPTVSYRYSLYENVGPPRTVTYQRKGSGRKLAQALYDPRIVHDIEAWLVKRLGPLAELDVEGVGDNVTGLQHSESRVPDSEPSAAVTRVTDLIGSDLRQLKPVTDPSQVSACDPSDPKALTDQLRPYESGILPDQLVALTRSTIRAAGITQKDAARRIGISRPQLANALQRRYGLSVEAAAQLLGFLEQPPPVRQLELC